MSRTFPRKTPILGIVVLGAGLGYLLCNRWNPRERSEPLPKQRTQIATVSAKPDFTEVSSVTPAVEPAIHAETQSPAETLSFLEQSWSESLTGQAREQALESLRHWAEQMPHAAAEWVGRKPSGSFQNEALKTVALAWANRSATEAAAWVRNWPAEEKESGLRAVAYEAIRSSPLEALTLASELPANPARDALVAQAVREWASRDPESPVQWAQKIEAPDLRNSVISSAAISMSESDPAGAAQLVLKSLPPGAEQGSAVISIVQRWAQSKPQEAADWILGFPEGQVRDAAVENVVQLWSEQNRNAAAEWLNQVQDDKVRDLGLAAYARKIAPGHPEEAITWADAISDPSLREQELASLAALQKTTN